MIVPKLLILLLLILLFFIHLWGVAKVMTGTSMRKLLKHLRPLPGRGIVRRGPGCWWGEVVEASGYLEGTRVGFLPEHVEATFQKGKSHYVVVLIRNMSRVT